MEDIQPESCSPISVDPVPNGTVTAEETPVAKEDVDVAIASASESLSESDQNVKTEEEEDEVVEEEEEDEEDDEDEEEQEDERPSVAEDEGNDELPSKKLKALPVKEEDEGLVTAENGDATETELLATDEGDVKKTPTVSSKKKSKSKKKTPNSVWLSRSSRKGKKKTKPNPQGSQQPEDKVLITPVPRFFDKSDDSPDATICLSKVYKAEKVEVSEDRLSAGSSKGYRMVRATRGVCDGAWYYEIRLTKLGDTGHTRLGWSTEKGDLQAPVGYDSNSFGYRDVDGSKVHKALREKYGDGGYKEGDVIGFYINLPEGASYAPKPPQLVWYKGQRYLCAMDSKEDPPKIVPDSEISFFRNGVCQGVAFKDLYGGRYYPAASMYTLPNQPNCEVKFNFGPEFECFPESFGDHPVPKPMIDVPYHGYDIRSENVASDDK